MQDSDFVALENRFWQTMQARDLWEQIAYAAWSCADPGVQFDGTFNEWHTCPADGKINATIPKETTIEQVTLEQALALIAARAARDGDSPKRASKRAAPKKAAKKKAAPKKEAPKSAAKKTPRKKPPKET